MPKQKKKAPSKVQTRSLQKQRTDVIERYAKMFAFELPKDYGKPTGKKGRPIVMTEKTIRKLEASFAYDSTVEEACIFAGITPFTYYEFIKKFPDFSNTVELLRNIPVMLIRRNVVRGAMFSQDNGFRYLEKKRKTEFSSKLELGAEVKLTHDVTPEAAAAIDNVFTLFEKKARDMRDEFDQDVEAEDAEATADETDGGLEVEE